MAVLELIKNMLSEQCFNRVYFTKHLTTKVYNLTHCIYYLVCDFITQLHKEEYKWWRNRVQTSRDIDCIVGKIKPVWLVGYARFVKLYPLCFLVLWEMTRNTW